MVPALPLALPALLPSALADEDDEALAAAMGALNAIVKKCILVITIFLRETIEVYGSHL